MKKKKIKTKHWLFLGIIVFIVVLIGVSYLILYSGAFTINDLKVEGAEITSENTAINRITSDLAGRSSLLGVVGSENILFWMTGTDKLNNLILPTAESIDIKSNFSKKSININIKERGLYGVVCKSKGNCFAFDNEGVVYAPAPYVKGELVLRIEDESSTPVVLGKKLFSKDQWLDNIFKTLNVLKSGGFKISSITIRNVELHEWAVELSSSMKFYFSLDFVPKQLSSTLKAVKERLDLKKLQYLDFRVEGRVYYK